MEALMALSLMVVAVVAKAFQKSSLPSKEEAVLAMLECNLASSCTYFLKRSQLVPLRFFPLVKDEPPVKI